MTGVVRVVARWHAVPGAAGRVRQLATELAAVSAREEGCLSFAVLESTSHPGRLVLLEEYAGEEGRRRHLESIHFRELVRERAVPLLAVREVDAYHLVHPSSERKRS